MLVCRTSECLISAGQAAAPASTTWRASAATTSRCPISAADAAYLCKRDQQTLRRLLHARKGVTDGHDRPGLASRSEPPAGDPVRAAAAAPPARGAGKAALARRAGRRRPVRAWAGKLGTYAHRGGRPPNEMLISASNLRKSTFLIASRSAEVQRCPGRSAFVGCMRGLGGSGRMDVLTRCGGS
jgi:hypothetical protein